jgi:phage protein D
MGLGIIIKTNNPEADIKLNPQVGSVEVYEKINQTTTYKIRFMIDICDQDIANYVETTLYPPSNLSVWAEAEDQLICLVSGPITKQEAHLEHGGAGSWLDIEGADVSHGLSIKVNKGVYHNVTDDQVVNKILNNYGIRPNVDVTPNSRHLEENSSLAQREYDLSFIRKLAQRNGFHFWVTFDNGGNATGHFKQRQLDGTPSAELRINLDKSNMDNLRINWDTNKPTKATAAQVNKRNVTVMTAPVDINDETKLGAQRLDEILGPGAHTVEISLAEEDAGALETRLKAALREAQWFINATCRTSLNRLCKLVQVHSIVEIQGAGSRHSGKYYVTGVKHTIDSVAHIMDLELERNAWGADAAGLQGLARKIF